MPLTLTLYLYDGQLVTITTTISFICMIIAKYYSIAKLLEIDH